MKDANTDALKRALFAVKDMRAKLEALEQAKKEPIAIIGAGYRLPGDVHDAESFWQVLRTGRDTVAEIPADRWDRDKYYDPDPDAAGKMYTRSGAFVADIDKFDPQFFGMAPREAASLDPQQRMLLEVAWEAFENAGYAPNKLAGSPTGVFVGFSNHDFANYLRDENGATGIDPYSGTGGAACIAVGRISYVLGLNGPNFAVDTACSSSLVAIHTAVQNLRSGKTDLALAGGVNLLLIPDPNIYLSRMRALSRDGRCKTFDASADGYGRGEGCALIVLKRLSEAQRDGDHILALIRGSAINHDGKSSGLTVPNAHAQQAVIRAALADAGIDPLHVSYLEAHGTGTPLGDPIEIRAAAAALCKGRSHESPLLVGSAKTNFAHLEAAAGITGLLKVVLALQHKEIPPHLHFNNPNPHIPWRELPLHIPTERMKWEGINGERIAGVSSFGFSGTNAHIVLQQANNDKKEKEPSSNLQLAPCSLLALSAKSEEALRASAQRFAQHLTVHEEIALHDLAYSANTGRAHFEKRLAVLADSTSSLREKLAAFAAQQSAPNVLTGVCSENERPKIAFLFTGQGAQYIDMGRELYETQPVFREALDKCDALLRPYLEVPLLEVLFSNSPLEGGIAVAEQSASSNEQQATPSAMPFAPCSLLDQTRYTQPALFALEYALAQLWQSWGVQPSAVLGHSVGEYVAACVAGMISLEEGLKLIAARGRLMQALPQNGAMAAIFADEEKVEPALIGYEQRVSIAALNGPRNLVISGERDAIEELVKKFEGLGRKSKALTVSHAFHSPLMEPMLDDFERIVSEITFRAPRVPLISNLTARPLAFSNQQPATNNDPQSTSYDPRTYYRRHAREAVRFSASMQTAHEMGCTVFLELGPHPVLLGMGRECLYDAEKSAWLPSLRKGQSDALEIMRSAATLYTRGAEINWENFTLRGRRIPLPTYPFQRERHWIEKRKGKMEGRGSKFAGDDAQSS
ncbi:type I polyketide synthase, partial [candidate division KSB1 bacterium]|nr:type I polyketide synthase [candidate division KSB1 bacterium]